MLKLSKWLLAIGFLGLLLSLGAVSILYAYLSPQLPSIEVLKEVRLQVPLRVYTSEGDLIAEFGEKRREPLQIEEIPPLMKKAFLAAEDDRFYIHPGVDYQGLLRALVNLIKTGKKGQGGSTITMQVARNFFLSREKTYLRKINEIFLALKIEGELTKDKILELYLNKIYLGNRAYGVGVAAKIYYGVPVQGLTLPQIAMIAGLPKAPSTSNPIADPERALIRRNYVLDRMYSLQMIDAETHQRSRDAAISARIFGADLVVDAGYVGEMARAKLVELFEERAYTTGLRVYTTVKTAHQAVANSALRAALLNYEERQGYRGAVAVLTEDVLADPELIGEALAEYPEYGGLRPAVVTGLEDEQAKLHTQDGAIVPIGFESLKWARERRETGKGPAPKKIAEVLAIGDVVYLVENEGQMRLVQMPEVEGAFVSLDPGNGAIQALVGGFDFRRSKFNRVMQAERQPGSNFKPFIYSAALDKGYSAASVINDAPVVFDDPALEDEWRPQNYSGKFFGPTRLREALVKSRNLVSIRLLIGMGLRHVMEYIDRFGFTGANLPRDLSLALGSGTLKPIQVAAAYATFANNGYLIDPYLIERVEYIDGTILFEANPAVVCDDICREGIAKQPGNVESATDVALEKEVEDEESLVNYAERVLEERNVYIMRSILRDVIRRGTGRRARSLGRRDLSGKTGTTNDLHDTWFSGFNNQLVATAWVGYDKQLPLGARETGGRTALPIWIGYMREALKGVPEDKLVEPEGMTSMLIDSTSGEAANADNADAIFEIFRVENAPEPAVIATTGGVKTEQEIEEQDETTQQLF